MYHSIIYFLGYFTSLLTILESGTNQDDRANPHYKTKPNETEENQQQPNYEIFISTNTIYMYMINILSLLMTFKIFQT